MLQSAARTGITKITSLDDQSTISRFHHALTSFCSRHRDVSIMLTWSPVHKGRIQDSTVRYKVLTACTITLRASLNRVQSASYQKTVSRRRAFTEWERSTGLNAVSVTLGTLLPMNTLYHNPRMAIITLCRRQQSLSWLVRIFAHDTSRPRHYALWSDMHSHQITPGVSV